MSEVGKKETCPNCLSGLQMGKLPEQLKNCPMCGGEGYVFPKTLITGPPMSEITNNNLLLCFDILCDHVVLPEGATLENRKQEIDAIRRLIERISEWQRRLHEILSEIGCDGPCVEIMEEIRDFGKEVADD
jgi:hypothetical protein